MSTQLRNHTSPAAPSLWTRVRHDLRERARVRAADRVLERELAAYRTPSEISDLLAAVDRQDAPEGEQVRRILARNLSDYRARNPHPS